jgi:hypothetical protein
VSPHDYLPAIRGNYSLSSDTLALSSNYDPRQAIITVETVPVDIVDRLKSEKAFLIALPAT